MHDTLPLLFAAPGASEIFSVLAAIVFFVIWLVNQINDAKKQQREKEQTAADAPPQPNDPAANAGAAPAPPQADPLRAQVDEFLRRAGRQPPAQPPAAAPAPPRKPAGREEIVVLLDESVAEPPRRTMPSSKGAPKVAPAAREKRSASAQPAARLGGKPRARTVAEHVAERAGASSTQFQQEVADLGQRVKQADEQFDRQLQQKFDHRIGRLATASTTTETTAQPTPATPAAQIAALMTNPEGVRQAIVLNEILRRPTDRW
ncbi:MAG: hypothetical protein AB7G28_19900 [Pirellulales bacterium]